MRKIADLYFDKRPDKGDLIVRSYENMRDEDQNLVQDLMRNYKVSSQINNACRDVFSIHRTDKDQEIAKCDINLGGTAIESKVKVVITLLKDSDENDLKISIFSLVQGPAL